MHWQKSTIWSLFLKITEAVMVHNFKDKRSKKTIYIDKIIVAVYLDLSHKESNKIDS